MINFQGMLLRKGMNFSESEERRTGIHQNSIGRKKVPCVTPILFSGKGEALQLQ